ncbi:hypothetical protein NFI96_029190 [Prochilodus magdalenae]|nr:hypothetical protein NFI96_029190 [Prochilodus magdalenae]
MWLSLLALLTFCAAGKAAQNTSETPAEQEKLIIARGKLMGLLVCYTVSDCNITVPLLTVPYCNSLLMDYFLIEGSQRGGMIHKEDARALQIPDGALGPVWSEGVLAIPLCRIVARVTYVMLVEVRPSWCHNLEYDSAEKKKPRLIFYNEKDEVVKTVPVRKMTADQISDLLDSLGFYKRSKKGEEVPEEFKNFPLRVPRDEL